MRILALVSVDTNDGDLVTTERVAVLLRALWLASRRGEKMTTAAAQRLLCLSQWHSADAMLTKIERVVPELRRDLDGWWIDDCMGGTDP